MAEYYSRIFAFVFSGKFPNKLQAFSQAKISPSFLKGTL
jgi:hypothetical protein